MKKITVDEKFGSILVIVPHEDDEVLMAAGIIYRGIQAGISVKVVIVTNGDYGCENFTVGKARMSETLEGLKLLGLPQECVWFLGYADTGMEKEVSFLHGLYEETEGQRVHASSCSKATYGLQDIGFHKPDFHSAEHGTPGIYNRETLKADIKDVIRTIGADNIFTTSQYDLHGDHSGLYLFIREVLHELNLEKGYAPVLYSGIVHSLAGDDRWPVYLDFKSPEILPLSCPPDWEQTVPYSWEDRVVFPVPECMLIQDVEHNLKYRALSKHRTALKPDAVDYLYSFVKEDEVFFEISI